MLKKVKIDSLDTLSYVYLTIQWLTLNLMDTNELKVGSVNYWILISPTIIFASVCLPSAFKNKKIITNYTFYLIAYTGLVTFINLIRGDIALVNFTIIDTLVVIVIFQIKPSLSIKFVNRIFYIQLIISVVSYYQGINHYGFMLGQHSNLIEEGESIAVSMFPYSTPPLTATFAIYVLIYNLYFNTKNYVVIFLSSYFVLLSGCRTIIICFAFLILTFLLSKVFVLKEYKSFYFLLFVVVMFTPLFVPLVEFLLTASDNDYVNNSILRVNNNFNTTGVSVDEIDRILFTQVYFDAFLDNMVLGKGMVSIPELMPNHVASTKGVNFGTEAFFMKMLTQSGVSFIFYLSSLSVLLFNFLRKNNLYGYICIVTYVITLFYYGSAFRGYSFVYTFIFLMIINIHNNVANQTNSVRLIN